MKYHFCHGEHEEKNKDENVSCDLSRHASRDEEMAKAPEGMKTKDANGKGIKGLQFKIQISTLDCTGCGVCVEVCPAKTKALAMSPIHEEIEKGEIKNSEYLFNEVTYKDNLVEKNNAKN